MPVEQVKSVTNVGRTSLEAMRDLAELMLFDPELLDYINEQLNRKDVPPIYRCELDDFCESVAEGVDRIVVIDDEEID